ncbi:MULTISPECIES: NAD-dependent epimerase/dehydratase family protein [unclassified Streptomyces]|uniref:NAD-dependent epimerase/dehydratase family protein n=1 Tax=unclassified Streptomyces TaxID=2593676 RepID=UPI002E27CB92|nr:NAD-dependent epimerase/dehydratase family protein [Streptomyces sp. NBC_00223]
MRRILVLGGGGFLGAPVCARLGTGAGGTVLLRGERSPGHALTADLATVSVDTLARQLTALAPDAVVNCAGVVAGSASELCAVNARGPAVLAEAMAMATPAARLVHLGSAAEYGPAAAGTALSEQAAARPVGVYGASKLAGTLAVTGSGLDAVVLRVFNPVGAGASRAGLPGRLAAAFRDAPPHGTVRTGSLAAYRDFVDVTDVAEAVALAASAPGPLPPVVNIGSGRATLARTLAAELAEVAGFTGRIEESGARSPRSAEIDWHEADIALAVHILGWHPTRTLHSALTSLWQAAAPPLAHPEDPAPARPTPHRPPPKAAPLPAVTDLLPRTAYPDGTTARPPAPGPGSPPTTGPARPTTAESDPAPAQRHDATHQPHTDVTGTSVRLPVPGPGSPPTTGPARPTTAKSDPDQTQRQDATHQPHINATADAVRPPAPGPGGPPTTGPARPTTAKSAPDQTQRHDATHQPHTDVAVGTVRPAPPGPAPAGSGRRLGGVGATTRPAPPGGLTNLPPAQSSPPAVTPPKSPGAALTAPTRAPRGRDDSEVRALLWDSAAGPALPPGASEVRPLLWDSAAGPALPPGAR